MQERLLKGLKAYREKPMDHREKPMDRPKERIDRRHSLLKGLKGLTEFDGEKHPAARPWLKTAPPAPRIERIPAPYVYPYIRSLPTCLA